jgi:hypothetical protein
MVFLEVDEVCRLGEIFFLDLPGIAVKVKKKLLVEK